MKVLKFGAVWCTGCIVMKPRWQEIEQELAWLETEYHDVDEDKELAKSYQITDYPCFIFLDKSGTELHREYGEVEKDKLLAKLNELKDK